MKYFDISSKEQRLDQDLSEIEFGIAIKVEDTAKMLITLACIFS